MSSLRQITSTLIAIGLLAGAAAPDAAAQQDEAETWTIHPLAEVGWFLPLRNMGKNSTVLGQQGQLQVLAEHNSALTFGGGVEVDFPDRRLRLRLSARTTSGLTAAGVLSICQSGVIDLEEFCFTEETDATITDGFADLVFLSREAADISPVVFLGFGLRHFSFDSDPSGCFEHDPGDSQNICFGIHDIWAESSTDPALTFGAALQGDFQPVEAFLQFRAMAGGFGGGTDGADGETLVDALVTSGFSIRVF